MKKYMKPLLIILVILLTSCTRYVVIYVKPENKIPPGTSMTLPYIESDGHYLPVNGYIIKDRYSGNGGKLDIIIENARLKADSIVFRKP